MSTMNVYKALVLAGLLGAIPTLSFGATTGSISGVLKDQSGGAIPNGTVIVINTAQGVQTKATSDAKGLYVFPALAVGTYDLKAEAPGFKPQSKMAIAVDLDSAQAVDLTLGLAQKAEEVTVVGTPDAMNVAIETESTQVGEVVTSKQMTQVALNGRSYTDLLA